MQNLKTRTQAHEFYGQFLSKAKKEGGIPAMKKASAMLGANDLFYLLVYVLDRVDVDCDWLFARCREVQLAPNGYIDLWAREHYKSTIITYALTIQDIINDVNLRIAIFSVTRGEAVKFGSEIKKTCENNPKLYELWPDVFWQEPLKETRKLSAAWSDEKGLTFKRTAIFKENTLECWGLDAMPTGRHYPIRVYDDIITERHVTNPEQIKKSMEGWRLSANLGSAALIKHYKGTNIRRIIGTRYHQNDPYGQILREKIAVPRIYPATDNGKDSGKPVFFTSEFLHTRRQDNGPYQFACQYLQNPQADEAQGFNPSWNVHWKGRKWDHLNRYLLCDPAGERKRSQDHDPDYTVMLVIGLGEDQNYYLIDGVRDRMNLTQRTKQLFRLQRKYTPLKTGYEKYGKDSDIEHIEYVMEREHYRFPITPVGGRMPKLDRIRKLIPPWESGRIYLPLTCPFMDYEKKQRDLTQELKDDELLTFPVGSHDDILDCFARILDPEFGAEFPMTKTAQHHSKFTDRAKTDYDIWDNIQLYG